MALNGGTPATGPVTVGCATSAPRASVVSVTSSPSRSVASSSSDPPPEQAAAATSAATSSNPLRTILVSPRLSVSPDAGAHPNAATICGRSTVVRMPGGAPHTTGTALTAR